MKEKPHITSRQPTMRAGYRMLAFTKPANVGGKEKKHQVNPAMRLPAMRYSQW